MWVCCKISQGWRVLFNISWRVLNNNRTWCGWWGKISRRNFWKYTIPQNCMGLALLCKMQFSTYIIYGDAAILLPSRTFWFTTQQTNVLFYWLHSSEQFQNGCPILSRKWLGSVALLTDQIWVWDLAWAQVFTWYKLPSNHDQMDVW